MLPSTKFVTNALGDQPWKPRPSFVKPLTASSEISNQTNRKAARYITMATAEMGTPMTFPKQLSYYHPDRSSDDAENASTLGFTQAIGKS